MLKQTTFRTSRPVAITAALLAFLCYIPQPASAVDLLGRPLHDCCDAFEEEEEEVCGYGPDVCTPRGTLMQWSYGTSFSGGPDLDEPLITDRPDFTESSVTVGRGVTQIEMGYSYAFDEEGNDSTKAHSYPQLLIRHGILAEWLELRIVWSYADEDSITGGTRTRPDGSEDMQLGLKIALTPQECFLPEMALIPQMNIPTGSDEFTSDEVLPGLNWVYSWEVNDCLSIAGSTQGNRVLDETTGDAYLEWAQSMTLAFGLTDRIGAYTEWYAFFPHSADTAVTQHYLNGGFTVLVSKDLQLDFFVGLGLNDDADDYFVGTGLSRRF